jgi:hypothetical protein
MSSASVLTFLPAGDCPTVVNSQLNSTQLHCTALNWNRSLEWYSLGADHIENTASNSSVVAAHRCHIDRTENTASQFTGACKNLLPSNERCLQSHYLAAALRATIWIYRCEINTIFIRVAVITDIQFVESDATVMGPFVTYNILEPLCRGFSYLVRCRTFNPKGFIFHFRRLSTSNSPFMLSVL